MKEAVINAMHSRDEGSLNRRNPLLWHMGAELHCGWSRGFHIILITFRHLTYVMISNHSYHPPTIEITWRERLRIAIIRKVTKSSLGNADPLALNFIAPIWLFYINEGYHICFVNRQIRNIS
jgi:hypothetical protein